MGFSRQPYSHYASLPELDTPRVLGILIVDPIFTCSPSRENKIMMWLKLLQCEVDLPLVIGEIGRHLVWYDWWTTVEDGHLELKQQQWHIA